MYAEVAAGGQTRYLGDEHYREDLVADRCYLVRVFTLAPRRVGVAFNDVTGERRAEDRVVQTLESMSDAFYTLDVETRFTFVNAVGQVAIGPGADPAL